MKRRLFNVAAIVSLLGCVATIVLWIWCKDVCRGVARGWEDRELRKSRTDWVLVQRGVFMWSTNIFGSTTTRFTRTDYYYYRSEEDNLLHRDVMGFEASRGTNGASNRWSYCAVPCWFIVAALAIVPGVRLYTGLRDRKRHVTRCCSVCGYDLRATPDRCPECGTAVGQVA